MACTSPATRPISKSIVVDWFLEEQKVFLVGSGRESASWFIIGRLRESPPQIQRRHWLAARGLLSWRQIRCSLRLLNLRYPAFCGVDLLVYAARRSSMGVGNLPQAA